MRENSTSKAGKPIPELVSFVLQQVGRRSFDLFQPEV